MKSLELDVVYVLASAGFAHFSNRVLRALAVESHLVERVKISENQVGFIVYLRGDVFVKMRTVLCRHITER